MVKGTIASPYRDRALRNQRTRRARNGRPLTIGLFDSGVGGLTVLKELRKLVPEVRIVYFADMLRQPYGPRTQEEVARFSLQILTWLKEQGCDAGIIACNTATCATYDNEVDKEFPKEFQIYGTIPYAAEAAKKMGKRVGVIATEGTVSVGAYSRALGDNIDTIEMPCPAFAGYAEKGMMNGPKVRASALQYLQPILEGEKPVDTLVYGCTHYPLLSEAVESVMQKHEKQWGTPMQYIDPAKLLAQAVRERVDKENASAGCKEMVSQPASDPRFCVNFDPEGFQERAGCILKFMPKVEQVELPPLPPLPLLQKSRSIKKMQTRAARGNSRRMRAGLAST